MISARAVGYCENMECEDYAKGVFLLNFHRNNMRCQSCQQDGKVVPEKGYYEGESDRFKEVRLYYNYDSPSNSFREVAILRDESLWGSHNVYHLESPLIKTERRAVKVAEAILASLNRNGLSEDMRSQASETVLSFDWPMDKLREELQVLQKSLAKSHLAERSAA